MLTLLLLIGIFIAIAAGLAWFLISHDHGQDEPIGALWIAAGLGVVGAVLASVIEGHLINPVDLQPIAAFPKLIKASLSVGIIEELCKFLPLAIFLYRKKFFNEHTDGIIYFALAGLGFGLPENILYTLQFGAQAGVGRIILTPFFHAAGTAIVGYYLIRYKLAKKSPYRVAGPLATIMLIHGFYDMGLSSGRTFLASISLVLTFALSAALFVLYVRATELDQDTGLSATGHNKYCRSCGAKNPHRYLYCTQCGKNA